MLWFTLYSQDYQSIWTFVHLLCICCVQIGVDIPWRRRLCDRMWFGYSRSLQSNMCTDRNSGKVLEEVLLVKLLKEQSMYIFEKWQSLAVKHGWECRFRVKLLVFKVSLVPPLISSRSLGVPYLPLLPLLHLSNENNKYNLFHIIVWQTLPEQFLCAM